MKLKEKLKRIWLRMSLIPSFDAPLEAWQYFAENAPRWLVEETLTKWLDDMEETIYWHRVKEMLNNRCTRFERPILSSSFIKVNLYRICFVAEGTASEVIATIGKSAGKDYPFFVVEKGTNKMLGIVLNQKQVFAGVINRTMCSATAEVILRKNGMRFLSSEDVSWFPCFQKEVSVMLTEVGLDSLGEWYWYEDSVSGQFRAWNTKTQQKGISRVKALLIGKF